MREFKIKYQNLTPTNIFKHNTVKHGKMNMNATVRLPLAWRHMLSF